MGALEQARAHLVKAREFLEAAEWATRMVDAAGQAVSS
jgi:hypothetical protein